MAFEALMALSFEGDPAAPTQELSPAAPTLQPPKAKWATPSAPAKWAAPRTPPKAPPKSPPMETAKTSAPMATDVDEGHNDVHDDNDGKSAGGKSRSRAHLPFRQLSGKFMKRGGALSARFRFFPKHPWPNDYVLNKLLGGFILLFDARGPVTRAPAKVWGGTILNLAVRSACKACPPSFVTLWRRIRRI